MTNKRLKLWLVMNLSMFLAIAASTVVGVMAANAKPELTKTGSDVLIGKTITLTLKKKPSPSTILWKSHNKRIASVTKTGKVNGIAKGNAKITATVIANKKKSRFTCKVRVVKKAKRIVITTKNGKAAKNVSLITGNKTSLKVTKNPKNSNDFVASWKSTNVGIARVGKNGVVTAKKPGTTTITATMFGKAKATINVTVNGKVNDGNTPNPKPTFTPTKAPTTSPSYAPMGTPTIPPTNAPTDAPTDISYDFSNSTQGFTGRGPATATATTFEGVPVLYVTGRTQSWNGATINLTNVLKVGHTYSISAEILHTANENATVNSSLEIKLPSKADAYPGLASASAAPHTWKSLNATVTIEEFNQISLYFQLPNNDNANFYLKDVRIKEVKRDPTKLLSYESLADLAKQYGFSMGTCIDKGKVSQDSFAPIVLNHFNSITAGNEMKAYSLLDQQASMENAVNGDKMPRMDFTDADKIMTFARDNGIKVRGHTLVWHYQMSSWFFREGYRSDGAFITDTNVMKARLESYVKQVLEHFQTEFPGVINAWDVVNEAVGDGGDDYEYVGDKWDDCHIRTHWDGNDNPFYRYIGRDYVKLSFQYARKYAAKDVKLFYNDYSTIYPDKRNAICNLVKELNAEEPLVDGVGMQCYIDMDYNLLQSYPHKDAPSVVDSVNAFYDLGMEVHLTELTVRNRDINKNGEHANYFGALFEVIKNLNRETVKITNVSIWGLVDTPNAQEGDYGYGLSGTYYGLIDETYQPKESFVKVHDSLKSGHSEIAPYKFVK